MSLSSEGEWLGLGLCWYLAQGREAVAIRAESQVQVFPGDQGTFRQGESEAEGGGAEQEGEGFEWGPGKRRLMIQAANEVLVYGRSKAEAPEKEKQETLPSWFAIL